MATRGNAWRKAVLAYWLWVGAVLLLSASAWLALATQALHAERDEVAATVNRLAAAQKLPAKSATAQAMISPLDSPPPEETSNAVVARIGSLAKEQGVVAGSVSVQNPENKPGGLRQIKLTARLTGQYPQLKTVLSKLMEEFPTLAMDEVSMRRDQTQVEAEVRWSLYVQGVPAASVAAAKDAR